MVMGGVVGETSYTCVTCSKGTLQRDEFMYYWTEAPFLKKLSLV